MNKVNKFTVIALLGVLTFSSSAFADVKNGQKLFLKKFKAPCGFNGSKFAGMHTQDEWEAIHQAGKFAEEAMKICPKLKKVKAKYVPDVYDFVYEYAKDSEKVPSC